MVTERSMLLPVIIMQRDIIPNIIGFEGNKKGSTFTYKKLNVQDCSQVIILLRLRLLIHRRGIIQCGPPYYNVVSVLQEPHDKVL